MDLFSVIFMYLNLGLEHIITGYDHILFLLVLIIISKRFVDVLKIVTAFTVAHSITLFLASMEMIPLYPMWVEAAIALTICYVTIENFFIKTSKWRWVLTFVFGLIHGIGFASSIQDIGFNKTYFMTSLISFNIGIEMGQLAIVAIVLPILLKLQNYPKFYNGFFLVTSLIIFVISAYWFVERILV